MVIIKQNVRLNRQDQFATGTTFVTENVGMSLLNIFHRIFFVDERS